MQTFTAILILAGIFYFAAIGRDPEPTVSAPAPADTSMSAEEFRIATFCLSGGRPPADLGLQPSRIQTFYSSHCTESK